MMQRALAGELNVAMYVNYGYPTYFCLFSWRNACC